MLKFVVWDVQHGSASYIRTPNNKHFAVDLGTGTRGRVEFSPLLHLRDNWNVSRMDGVFITHPHRDHIDDIFSFDALNPRVLWRPNHLAEDAIRNGNRLEDSEKVNKYLEIHRRYNCAVEPGNSLTAENLGSVEIKVFSPTRCPTTNINNHSLVLVVTYLGVKILLPGDNEPPSWLELLERPEFREAIRDTHIFVAPHHGRESGYCPELVERLAPAPLVTVVSDGRFCDTSCPRYSERPRGWDVKKRSGGTENRKCLTTRADGSIVFDIYPNPAGGAFMNVEID